MYKKIYLSLNNEDVLLFLELKLSSKLMKE